MGCNKPPLAASLVALLLRHSRWQHKGPILHGWFYSQFSTGEWKFGSGRNQLNGINDGTWQVIRVCDQLAFFVFSYLKCTFIKLIMDFHDPFFHDPSVGWQGLGDFIPVTRLYLYYWISRQTLEHEKYYRKWDYVHSFLKTGKKIQPRPSPFWRVP